MTKKSTVFLGYTGVLTDDNFNDLLELWYELDISKHCILERSIDNKNTVGIHILPINFIFVFNSFKDGLLSHHGWDKYFSLTEYVPKKILEEIS